LEVAQCGSDAGEDSGDVEGIVEDFEVPIATGCSAAAAGNVKSRAEGVLNCVLDFFTVI